MKFPTYVQIDSMDCGPASLMILNKYYKRSISIDSLREYVSKGKYGSSVENVCFAFNAIGYRSNVHNIRFEEIAASLKLPSIVYLNSNNHFAVIYNIARNRVFLSDPAVGLISYSQNEFIDKWKLNNSKSGIIISAEYVKDKDVFQDEMIDRKSGFFDLFKYLWGYLDKLKWLLSIGVLGVILQGMLPFISKSIIDLGVQRHDLEFIQIVLFTNLFILILVFCSNLIKDALVYQIVSRVNVLMLSDYLVKLLKLPIKYFESKTTGDIIQRIIDQDKIRSFFVTGIGSFLFSSLTLVGFSIILFIYNDVVFFVFFIGSLIYLCWVFSFMRIRRVIENRHFELQSKLQSYWVENIDGIREIKVLDMSSKRISLWEDMQADLVKNTSRTYKFNSIQQNGANFIDSVKNLLITFFCAKNVINGNMTFGEMISSQFMIGMLNAPVQQFVAFVTSARVAQFSFKRFSDVHEVAAESNDSVAEVFDTVFDEAIIFKRVSFQYFRGTGLTLKNVTFIVPPGKVTAIVGSSGSGKSTLFKLLLRLYEPNVGTIEISNRNINTFNLNSLRTKLGAVAQDGFIFNASFLSNIVLDDTKFDRTRFHEVISVVQLANEISRFPKGYHTEIGENGVQLSMGQRQRVLIARVLYQDPRILLLDEFTSFLDTINEQKLIDALITYCAGKTIILTAHRMTTVRKASHIIVMKDGTISEVGTHNSLMDKRGEYYKLNASA